MTVQNRTQEFFNAVDSMRQRSGQLQHSAIPTASLISSRLSGSTDSQPLLNSNTPAGKSQFSRYAAQISRDISQTAFKLEKLTKLAKKKSLFEDRPEEINELTSAIKADIGQVAIRIKELEVIQQNELNDKLAQGKSNGKLAKEHTSNIIMALQSKLASASSTFKDALEIRSQNLKSQQDKKEQISYGQPQSQLIQNSQSLSIASSQSPLYQTLRQQNATMLTQQTYQSQQMEQSENEFISISIPIQQQELLQLNQNDQYMDSRAQAIEGIEKTINDLAGLFQQLTSMISQHDDLVRRIDDNVEDIESNVFGAQNQLTRYMQGLQSNRWLMAKVFSVIILFFIIFMLFFA